MKNNIMKKSIIFITVILMAFFLSACDLDDFRSGNIENTNKINNINYTQTDFEDAFVAKSRTETGEVLTAPQAAEKIIHSVVGILNYENASDISQTSEGTGIIMTQDGYIITNAHVIKDAAVIKVVFENDEIFVATDFWYDIYTDLGLIKIEATGLTAAEFGMTSELVLAEDVLAVGNPGGLQFRSSVTKGIVSSLNRPYEAISGSGYFINCIQTDAAINPGNSGGALVNMYGQVVGINSAKIADVNYEGMGFSISIDEALPILSELKQNRFISGRPAIGITYQFVSVRVKESGIIKNIVGLQIEEITNPALASVLKVGDIITQINDQPLASTEDISAALSGKKPGDTITIKYYRLGTETYSYYNATSHTITITLIEANL